MNSPNVVLYTSIFGGYDPIVDVRQYHRPNLKFVCFTDRPEYNLGWDIKETPLNKELRFTTTMTARSIKTQPHKHLPLCDINVYVDANKPVKDIDAVLKMCQEVHESKEIDAIFVKHHQRDTLVEEMQEILIWQRDNEEIVKNQVAGYFDEGYADDTPLIVTSMQVRKTNSPTMIELMDTWWNEIRTKSCRDQLSFPYVIWKCNFKKYRLIQVDDREAMFNNYPHGRKIR